MEWNQERIVELLRESAAIALRYYEAPGTRIKSDQTLVTEADHAIEARLVAALERPEQESYVIGEETINGKPRGYAERALAGVAWVIDPIDGTAPYAHHIPTWGISIARTESGRITDGAVYLPVTDELFITSGDLVEYGPIEGPRRPITGAGAMAMGKQRSSGMIALSQEVAKGRGIDVPNPVQALGCAVMPLTYLLLGRYLAYLGKVKLWDCAGVLPMLARAGFVSALAGGAAVDTRIDGELYRLDADDPDRWLLNGRLVCASSRELIDYLVGSLAR